MFCRIIVDFLSVSEGEEVEIETELGVRERGDTMAVHT